MFSGAGSSVRHALVLLPVGGRRITVRTSAPDSSLPSPGTRATLSYAAVMPKLVAGPSVGSAIQTASGAHHFRFNGIEILSAAGASTPRPPAQASG
ncbi:MAG: hypothetical protein AUI47_10385 [Acidobacteria bacterium 13_1_40CM_2_68_5]|nr:MAG: hypothetical protein AUI47_10385 [Acidobacteria bacterium 13_1_40CM_2_68_5]PYN80941.1 MAG: hypothetical protein DMD96_12805 [Candidatus Rokubacteria bacterium]